MMTMMMMVMGRQSLCLHALDPNTKQVGEEQQKKTEEKEAETAQRARDATQSEPRCEGDDDSDDDSDEDNDSVDDDDDEKAGRVAIGLTHHKSDDCLATTGCSA